MGYPSVSVGECREPQTALCVTVRILGVLGRTRRLGLDRSLSMRPHRLGDVRCGKNRDNLDSSFHLESDQLFSGIGGLGISQLPGERCNPTLLA